jgi:anti-sigma factor RsiW
MTDPRGLTCQELVELVTEYLEATLPASDREHVENHLSLCRGCADYLEQMRQTIAAAGRLREEELDPKMRDQLMDLFREWARSR